VEKNEWHEGYFRLFYKVKIGIFLNYGGAGSHHGGAGRITLSHKSQLFEKPITASYLYIYIFFFRCNIEKILNERCSKKRDERK